MYRVCHGCQAEFLGHRAHVRTRWVLPVVRNLIKQRRRQQSFCCCATPTIFRIRPVKWQSWLRKIVGATRYEYAHNHPDAVAAQDYLGVERTYYRPVERGFEQELAARLAAIRTRLRKGKEEAK